MEELETDLSASTEEEDLFAANYGDVPVEEI
jgi:hypothetical protein